MLTTLVLEDTYYTECMDNYHVLDEILWAFYVFKKKKSNLIFKSITEDSEPCQKSKIERFAKIVNS